MSRHCHTPVIAVALLACLAAGCGEDKTENPVNTAPVASFSVSPTRGTMQTVFEFDASGSWECQGTTLEARWDWEDDATWDTDWSDTLTASHQYESLGSRTVRLEVRDAKDQSDDTTGTVEVRSAAPSLVLVPVGSFEMGESGAYCGTCIHQVTLTRGFYLGKYEVTNWEYRDALQWAYDRGYVAVGSGAVVDNLDGSTKTLVDLTPGSSELSFSDSVFTVDAGRENYPMVGVTWFGSVAYCDWVSLEDGLARAYDHSTWRCNGGDPYGAAGYRLPTDAEWEYATQYNGERVYAWGDEAPDCSKANYWYLYYCVGQATTVGSYPGWTVVDADSIYDMAGNVWEWVNDWYEYCTGKEPVTDPKGPSSGTYRPVRGSSWDGSNLAYLRCASRIGYLPNGLDRSLGLRCARTAQ